MSTLYFFFIMRKIELPRYYQVFTLVRTLSLDLSAVLFVLTLFNVSYWLPTLACFGFYGCMAMCDPVFDPYNRLMTRILKASHL